MTVGEQRFMELVPDSLKTIAKELKRSNELKEKEIALKEKEVDFKDDQIYFLECISKNLQNMK